MTKQQLELQKLYLEESRRLVSCMFAYHNMGCHRIANECWIDAKYMIARAYGYA